MIRKFSPVALVATLALAACGGPGAQSIEDPREILTQSIEAMADLDTMHFALTLDGTVQAAEMGGSMSLDGTELTGSMALDGSAAQVSFAVPSFMGLSGEMRLVDGESFFQTSMSGPLWIRQEIPEDADDPLAQAADPQAALEEFEAFLDEDGVTLEKLEDVECGDGTCYHLQLNIAREVILESEEAAGAGQEMLDAIGEEGVTFDLRIDTDTRYLVGASTSFDAEELGSLELNMTFDGFGDPVEVEAPPEDEVTDEAFPMP